MINTDFHAAKEQDFKTLVILKNTVERNGFHENTKKAFAIHSENLMQCILEQRREVYKKLENFDFNHEHVSSKNHPPIDLRIGANVSELHNRIFNMITEVKRNTESISMGSYIVNPFNNEKYRVEDQFNESNKFMAQALDLLVSLIKEDASIEAEKEEPSEKETNLNSGESKKESIVVKHKLTEEDFDNNPDLAKAGFNLGDEIELGEAITQAETIINNNTPPVEPPVENIQPPAVTPIEEIEKQNAEEKKAPRKRSKKTQ